MRIDMRPLTKLFHSNVGENCKIMVATLLNVWKCELACSYISMQTPYKFNEVSWAK